MKDCSIEKMMIVHEILEVPYFGIENTVFLCHFWDLNCFWLEPFLKRNLFDSKFVI